MYTNDLFTCVGAISGTSMDAIDVAVLRTDGEKYIEFLGASAGTYSPQLRKELMQIARVTELAKAARGGRLEAEVAVAFAEAIRRCLDELALTPADVDYLGCHGQTVWHEPDARITVQLVDCAVLAKMLGIATIGAFRQADVAAGGQGAPLAPLYHVALAAGQKLPIALLNLGGVGNVTYIGDSELLAFDTGPANALLDDFVATRTGAVHDTDGKLAAAGTADKELVERFLADSFFALQPPKSLDRFHFHGLMNSLMEHSDADGAATLARLTVVSVRAALEQLPDTPHTWYVTGGGRHNGAMMQSLGTELAAPVLPIEQMGARGDTLEAEAFAYLAARSVRGLPLSLPSTTGVPRPQVGGECFLP